MVEEIRMPDPAALFSVGGTLHPNARSYVTRPADEELFQRVSIGQLCYVLTARQMGKSSLMIRTADRLRRQRARAAIVDLSGLGTQSTRDQWYLGIVKRLARDLQLEVDPEQWWHDHERLDAVQRFTEFLHDVALGTTTEPIVIFIDEIDSTLKLDFTDDFFAAIRAIYNDRTNDPIYERLTFVLLGVATPSDLIKDRERTPFNIGHSIDLQDLSREGARPLEDGLEQIYPGRGRIILDRIFYWTNGHPYLTQKLCLKIAEARESTWQNRQIDVLVRKLFLTEEAQKEDNLQFVRSNVEVDPQRPQLVQLYYEIYKGKPVNQDERSPIQNRLRLIGLVRTKNRLLYVHNEIYVQVFNRAWIRQNGQNPPPERARRALVVAIIVILLLIAIGAAVVVSGILK